MAELEKVRRVIARQIEGAPHETLLVIDAITGQNGLRQAELFVGGRRGRRDRAHEARRQRARAASRSRSRASWGSRSS